MVNYHQSLAFDCPDLSFNDRCKQWLLQEIFLLLFFLFCRSSFVFLELFKDLKQLSIVCSRVDI